MLLDFEDKRSMKTLFFTGVIARLLLIPVKVVRKVVKISKKVLICTGKSDLYNIRPVEIENRKFLFRSEL